MDTATLVLVAVAASAIKVLLLSSYRSTDFEVHRNWLAVTHSLPLREWYYEATSEWTLDYPPLFAYFEWLLAHVAAVVDPAMVTLSRDAYASDATVAFQRLSVVATDLLLVVATWRYVHSSPSFGASVGGKDRDGRAAVVCATVFNAGLLLVDHVHFQVRPVAAPQPPTGGHRELYL